MDTQDAYNTWALTYDDMPNRTRDLEAQVLREVLAGNKFNQVLEIGCGTGKNTGWLSEIADNLLALDFSKKMMELAQSKHDLSNVTFQQADITEPWNFVQADLIVCSLVLEHIANLEHIFQQAKLSLKKNGLIYICELHPFKQMLGSRAKFQNNGEEISLEYFIHHISDYYTCAKNSGFTCIHFKEWFDGDDRTKTPRLCSFVFKNDA